MNSEVGKRPPARRGHRGLRPGGKAENRGQRTEVGGQMTEDRSRRTEVRGQRRTEKKLNRITRLEKVWGFEFRSL